MAHDRAERSRPSYLPKLQNEILEVIRKYVFVEQNAISVKFEQDDQREILELEIILPEGGMNASVRGAGASPPTATAR